MTQPIGKGGEPIAMATVGGGYLVARTDLAGDPSQVSFVPDPHTGGTGPGVSWPYDNSGFASSPDGTTTAFIEPDGTAVAVEAGAARYFDVGRFPAGDTYVIDAITGENCSGRSEDVGCTIYAHSNGPDRAVYALSPHVAAKKVFGGFERLAGISKNGLVAGMTSATDSGSCWAVRDDSGAELWHTCASSLISFSPDGQFVLAGSASADGAGDSTLTILEARTGKPVLDLKSVTDGLLTQQTWETSDQVIATVYDHGRWAVERIYIDGRRELAAVGTAPDLGSYVSPYKIG
jgi:hypothetical protein